MAFKILNWFVCVSEKNQKTKGLIEISKNNSPKSPVFSQKVTQETFDQNCILM